MVKKKANDSRLFRNVILGMVIGIVVIVAAYAVLKIQMTYPKFETASQELTFSTDFLFRSQVADGAECYEVTYQEAKYCLDSLDLVSSYAAVHGKSASDTTSQTYDVTVMARLGKGLYRVDNLEEHQQKVLPTIFIETVSSIVKAD